ncbi:MAG TPA: hypothetical protein VN848_09360 [Gemmatimonadales bacterium]|nr:hypothetical protein [Gemmatimonadales bacterium]
MPIGIVRDPRARLVQEKYFSLRPRPLERWLWAQGIPASAERVFWLHWQEGMKRGDWCSEVPIKRVAADCHLDVSTVTRAYQLLIRLGCVRRTDPGRDPGNPFQQATAVTEVRIPRELLVELDRHPSRALRRPESTADTPPTAARSAPKPRVAELPEATDPFAGLSGRERFRALSQLTRAMSPAERQQYDEALRTHRAHLAFDPDSRLSAEERGRVLQHLSTLTAQPKATLSAIPGPRSTSALRGPRLLSVFELARLKRDVQGATSSAAAPELLRQVVWSIEEGALRRFSPPHAIHIALKKIREGAWTRPNRMPPNWARMLRAPSRPETCSHA